MAGEREWAAPVKAAASGAGRVQDWWAEEAAGGAGRADEASAGAMAVAERSRRGRAEEAGPAEPSIELDEEEKDGRERKNRGDDKLAHR